ncbi:hypothetical protein P3S67_023408 [Capsicum chacoense]
MRMWKMHLPLQLDNRHGQEDHTIVTHGLTQVYAQAPQNLYQNPLYPIPPPPYQVYNAQPYVQPPSYPHWRAPTLPSHPPTPHTYRSPSRPGFQFNPNNEMRQKSGDNFTPIGESYASLFQRLVQQDMITPLLGVTVLKIVGL